MPAKVVQPAKWDAADYAANSAVQQSWARELIARLKLRGDEHVLDVGCGDGKVTAEIARAVPRGAVMGVDASAEMIKFAKKTFPTAKSPNLKFSICDAREISPALCFKTKSAVAKSAPLPMNPLSQTGAITSLNAGESSWNNLFYAHPHPCPLPRGEGETVAAPGQKGGGLVHGGNARRFRGNLSPLGRGEGARDDGFDVVFSNAALHWVDDHEAFLRGASAVLKPGGRLVVSCGGKGNAHDVFLALRPVMRLKRWCGFFRNMPLPYFFYAPGDYEKWLPLHGFKINALNLAPKDATYDGAEGFATWLRATWLPFVQRVPEDVREEFIAAATQRYLAKHQPDAENQVHVRMVRLEIDAVKI